MFSDLIQTEVPRIDENGEKKIQTPYLKGNNFLIVQDL